MKAKRIEYSGALNANKEGREKEKEGRGGCGVVDSVYRVREGNTM